ncbi:lysophospholipid acyltransferase family protein [Ammoniphilus oxalaticus]|uniref:lysophospholipid acyltransferase family protein n=1 Tax=Ammoniphilus oxalaticus TaxID=66863 RepID=UPI001FE3C26B|nr:lysophospholipid acyltransferase family protein [Ammoniphilus oxalaticus]
MYHTIRAIVKFYLHLRFRIKIEGIEHIPKDSCILAMNHTSNYDPILVGTHTPRKMYIMAKEELFRIGWFGRLITEMGAFPIKRGQADLKSLKHSLKLLKDGQIFSIFIEGTRSKSGEIQEAKKGIGFIAARSKATVIPTYIHGVNNGWFKPAGVVFGPPIEFPDGLGHEEIANLIAEEIRKLKQQHDSDA